MLADELESLRLRARWVSLSACQSARALVSPGEEWFGLSRSLLLAGTGAVLAAQWDVDVYINKGESTVDFLRIMRDVVERSCS